VRETQEETIAGTEKEDIAITPLAVPLLAGAGARFSTVILLQKPRPRLDASSGPAGVHSRGVSLATYLILRVSARGPAKVESDCHMKITPA